jgi:DNA-binding transcriptional MocR family regulator
MVGSLRLDPRSTSPLYRQLYERLRSAISAGDLRPGDRLPPTRELAGQLGLNRTTIAAAYALLDSDGLIEGHVGRGSFVRASVPAPGICEGDGVISFASSRPSKDDFPLADFQDAAREVIAGPDAASILQLGSPFGYAPLREHLLARARSEGAAGPDDDILITSGCQQAFDLVQRVLAKLSGAVAIEDPVYHGIRNVFTRDGQRVHGLGVTASGIDLDELERVFAQSRATLLVVTPNFQNPTGATMPVEARRHTVDLARRFGAIVVENDIYGALRYEGEPAPSMKSLGSTILLRSFSKIAFPGMRVGWIIAPRGIIARLAEARQWCDLHTDQLSQAIFLRFAESGALDKHIARVRRAGADRLRAVLDACAAYLPAGTEFTRPSGGLNLWVTLPAPLDAADLLRAAERNNVTYVPGRHFAVSRLQTGALRLSFGSVTSDRIRAGIAMLGRVFAEELEKGRSAMRMEASPALV